MIKRCRRGFVIVSMGNMTHISFETDRIKRRIRAKVGYIKDKKKWAYKSYRAKIDYQNSSAFHRALMGEWLCVECYK
jgi:hypothetical protein